MINVFIQYNKCASVTDDYGTKPEELNGKLLRVLGLKLNLSELRMVGQTIENIEGEIDNKIQNIQKENSEICKISPCFEWSEWSKCSSTNMHIFGSKFRTRQCNLDRTACKLDTKNSKIEKEFGICGGLCPHDHNVTRHGFCLKFYNDRVRNRYEAELQCKEDGGYLINIDSEIKHEDVKSLSNATSRVYIDGTRKDVGSPWKFSYGSQNTFLKWSKGQPSNSPDVCVMILILTY